MDTDIVPMAFRNDNLVRRQKEPKATIIFAAPHQSPRDSPAAKRYRFSVDSGSVITPNMIAGGGAKATGKRLALERDTTTSTTTASTTTTAETSTSGIPSALPNTMILGRILRPSSSSAEITARPRFTLIVKDRLERPIEPSKNLSEVTVTKTHEAEAAIEPKKMMMKKKKKGVTRVAQLKEALGYGEEDRRELWQLLGRRRRHAEERQGRGHGDAVVL